MNIERMYKVDETDTGRLAFQLAFLFLAFVSIAVVIINISSWWKIFILLLSFLTTYFFLDRNSEDVGKEETRKAMDRVSTAVIGLLHSTSGISSLQTYNRLIRENMKTQEKALQLLDQESVIIDEYADKIKSIVEDLSESFRTDRERTDIGQLVSRSVEYMRLKRIRDNHIPFSLNLSGESLYSKVYPSLLKTAVENILENSCNALTEGKIPQSRIDISVNNKNGRVFIVIRDNGKGLPGVQGEIPLDRIKPGRSSRKEGNGLGLYVAIQAVDECRGDISMFSYKDGLETRISLPGAK